MSLSARDSAFLTEMGIGPIWTLRDQPAAEPAPSDAPAAATFAPEAPAAPAPIAQAPAAPAPVAPAPASAPVAKAPAAEPAQPEEVGEDAIAAMDWQQLDGAIDTCTRCGLCKNGRKPVHGSGARSARWMVAAGASNAQDEAERQQLAGDTGKLLTNMLAAVSLSRERDVYLTNLVKCRPVSANGGERAPSAEEVAACRPYLARELALCGAGTLLTLGQIAANGLLGKPLPTALAGSRGSVHQFDGVPMVATLHPGELLRRGTDKALSWVDLCLAMAANERAG